MSGDVGGTSTYVDVVFFGSEVALPIRRDEVSEWEEIHLALFGEVRFRVV